MVFRPIKSDIDTIGWKDEYRGALEDYVLQVHMVITHSYAFCKFMFLSELTVDENFQLSAFINDDFFKEVFFSLIVYNRTTSPSKDEEQYRELIQKHLASYLTLADWTPPEMPNAELAVHHIASEMQRAYIDSLQVKLDKLFRRAINVVSNVDERKQTFRKELIEQGLEGQELKDRISKDLTQPIRSLKEEILAGNLENVNTVLGSDGDLILHVFRAYPPGYQFKDNSIAADVCENPYPHFLPKYRLIQLLEQKDSSKRSFFPLRRSFVPRSTRIDTGILCNCILKISPDKFQDGIQPWGLVVNLQHELFQEKDDYHFRGAIATNGVSVTVIKELMVEEIDSDDNILTVDEIQDPIPYIHQMPQADLADLENKCVLVDPGTSDLVYCMHETSSDEKPITYSYTNKQRRRFITNDQEYIRGLETTKKENLEVFQAQEVLARHCTRNNSLEDFTQYIRARGAVSDVLVSYYANYKAEDSDGSQYGYRHRKLILERRKKEALMIMVEEMKNAFGLGAVLVFGDWSTFGSQRKKVPHAGVRNLLQENGFKLAYIDEYRSSKICPSCHQYSLQKIEDTFDVNDQDEVMQPEKSGTNFLRCTSSACKNSQGKSRVWDRNFAAALNFRVILFSLRKLGIYPPQLQRPRFNFNTIY